MTYPFGGNSRRGSRRVVSLEKARKIAAQRDRLAEEVEELRRRNEELSEQRASGHQDREKLEERAEAAEKKVRELQAKLEERERGGEPREADREEESDEASELVERLTRRVASLTDDLERVKQKRQEELERARREERISILAGMGDVLDSVERGLAMQTEGPERQGLEAIHAQLLDFLSREGATLTGEVGVQLDPRVHEAVEVIESPDYESGEIVDVDRRGVLLEDGSVVMPAKVKVAD